MIRLTIYGQPVSKKNSMQLARIKGRFFPVPSISYRRWMRLAKGQVAEQMAGEKRIPLAGNLHLRILAYRHTKRRIDLSNIYAAVEDMLQKYRVIKNDDQIQSHDGSRKILGVPKSEARVEIELQSLDRAGGGQ